MPAPRAPSIRPRVLILGCGDIGARVALRCRQRGWPVHGVVRSAERAAALDRLAIACSRIVTDRPGTPPLPASDWVVYAAPPAQADDDAGFTDTLAALAASTRRLVYLSTSGVYGDCAGRWVDETEPLRTRQPRSARRIVAERNALGWSLRAGVDCVRLRIPGIYGPGRLPEARLRSGAPMVARAECPVTNRVHAEDLADAVVAALEHGRAAATYNVSDGAPGSASDYLAQCARALGLRVPDEVPLATWRAQASAMQRSFLDEPKRLRIERATRELGWAPAFSRLSDGITQSLGADAVVAAGMGRR